MNNNLESNLLFYQAAHKIIFKYQEEMKIADCLNMNYLKTYLIVPCKISFLGISRANIGRILDDLKEDNYEINIYKVKNSKNKLLKYEAIIYKKEKILKR